MAFKRMPKTAEERAARDLATRRALNDSIFRNRRLHEVTLFIDDIIRHDAPNEMRFTGTDRKAREVDVVFAGLRAVECRDGLCRILEARGDADAVPVRAKGAWIPRKVQRGSETQTCFDFQIAEASWTADGEAGTIGWIPKLHK